MIIIPDFFFTVNVFVLHPILFSSLLVALMWNVCAEPIECCVYIKVTLFLITPVFIISFYTLDMSIPAQSFFQTSDMTCFVYKIGWVK